MNFVDEEGARFGVACAGSRVITGALSPERALALRDADGVTMAEAMRAAGRQPEHWARIRRRLRRIGPSSSCTSSRAAVWSTSAVRSRVGSRHLAARPVADRDSW